ncbi:MAG: hypothetical protein FWD76_04945, partial [Firmicutes bacterium]|nr:hypothetical protein [Bacillota bacterium]
MAEGTWEEAQLFANIWDYHAIEERQLLAEVDAESFLSEDYRVGVSGGFFTKYDFAHKEKALLSRAVVADDLYGKGEFWVYLSAIYKTGERYAVRDLTRAQITYQKKET